MGCQDEYENEPEDEFFRSLRIKTVTNKPGPQYYDTLKDRFVRHAQVPERTKALVSVFVFVFVLAHEQAISIYFILSEVLFINPAILVILQNLPDNKIVFFRFNALQESAPRAA